MGAIMGELDTFGVPEYVHTLNHIEDAGFGLIRIVRCIKVNGVIRPVCSTVAPANAVLTFTNEAAFFVKNLLVMERQTAH